MADFRKEGRPCPIAHRGCMEAGPENSLTAFEEAAALGAGGVEALLLAAIKVSKVLSGQESGREETE